MGETNETKRTIDIKTILIGVLAILIFVAIILLLTPAKEPEKEPANNPENTEQEEYTEEYDEPDEEPVKKPAKEQKPVSDKSSGNKLSLVGDSHYYIVKGTKFEDPGVKAYNSSGNDISSQVVTNGTVNVNEIGDYSITYTLGKLKVKRTVSVYKFTVTVSAANIEYTNKKYNLTVSIDNAYYDKTLLPDGKTSTSKKIEYAISTNGTYQFVVSDTKGHQIKVSKKITNFDKTAPTGTCENKLDNGKTILTINAKDSESGISYFVYDNGKDTKTKKKTKYTYSATYKTIKVTMYDVAGNSKKIKCTQTGSEVMPQIKPPSGAKIKASADSTSLKVSIEEVGTYYIARVWILDPYNQIRKATSNWGVNREHPVTIFKREITNQNLSSKIFIGINASGFYENGTWSPSVSSEYYKKYNHTTEGGLVITNGKVVRNWYQAGAVDKMCFGTNELCRTDDTIYAVSKTGTFDTYQKFGRLSESDRKTLFQKIIDKGYRNTWVFRPVLMLKGKETADSTALTGNANTSKRTLVCQINTNNWILLVGNIANKDVLPKLKSLGCQTAVSMDGGGSYAMIFKGKTGSLQTIVGGSREIVDTLYITEK